MIRVLITGGNGNIATMIKNNLSSKYNITTLSHEELDVLHYDKLSVFLNNNSFDILVHTAILGGRRTKIENGEVTHFNLLMFENILKFADKFKMIINLDSAAIYDRSTDILNRKEDDLYTVPNDYYGFSKYIIYNRSLLFSNIFNFRIFNIFHKNEEKDRFIYSCFNSKKNNEKLTIFEDKYFDFVYENDFVKIVDYYFENVNNISFLSKTINICYEKKYKLSEIAEMIIEDKSLIEIINPTSNNNYSGCYHKLYTLPIVFDGLDKGLECYSQNFMLNNSI